METDQYEELCRIYIARIEGIAIEAVTSPRIPNPKRLGLPKYAHQIDLSWESGSKFIHYLNIANAKWRGAKKIGQGEILLLQQVRQQTCAHKALMITNLGFTAGAIAAAKDHAIGLHIVRPEFDPSCLPKKDRQSIRNVLRMLALCAAPLFIAEIVLADMTIY